MAKEQVIERDEDTDDSADEGDDEVEQKASVVEENGETKVRLPEDKKTRKQRRDEEGRGRKRYSDLEAEARQAREEAARERQRAAEAHERMLQTYREANGGAKRQESDPYSNELRNIRREQELISTSLRSGSVTSQEEADRLKERYYELDERRDAIREERLERRVTSRIPQQQAGTGEEAILRAEYADVSSHPGALAWAKGRYEQLRAEGKPGNLETARQAMREARENPYFGFARTPPRASEAQQARYGAVPAQAGTRQSSNEMTLSKEQKRMAIARFPQLEEHEAYARWAADFRKWEKENPL